MDFLFRKPGASRTNRAAAVIQKHIEMLQHSDDLNPETDAAMVARTTVQFACQQVPALASDELEGVTQAVAVLAHTTMQHTLARGTRRISAMVLARVLLEAHQDGLARSAAEKALLTSAADLLSQFNEQQKGHARMLSGH